MQSQGVLHKSLDGKTRTLTTNDLPPVLDLEALVWKLDAADSAMQVCLLCLRLCLFFSFLFSFSSFFLSSSFRILPASKSIRDSSVTAHTSHNRKIDLPPGSWRWGFCGRISGSDSRSRKGPPGVTGEIRDVSADGHGKGVWRPPGQLHCGVCTVLEVALPEPG